MLLTASRETTSNRHASQLLPVFFRHAVGTFPIPQGSLLVGSQEETQPMMKILAVTALSLGLATSAMAQSSDGGNNGGSGGNSGSTSGDTNSGTGNGTSTDGTTTGSTTSQQNDPTGSSNTNCGAPGGTQGAAQSEQNNGGSTNPGAGNVGTSC
jgi:hypothetical protein